MASEYANVNFLDRPVREEGNLRTVLVVEDNRHTRHFLKWYLTRLGFRVLLAEDGLSGINLFRNNQDQISIVILDMGIPIMNGAETFHAIRHLQQNTPIIACLYQTDDKTIELLPGEKHPAVITKPYDLSELETTLRQALQA